MLFRSVSASPSSNVTADGTASSTITVVLRDVRDNLASGKTVTLAKTSGPGSPTITTTQGVTDASGVATFTVTTTTAGVVGFTATDTTDANLQIGTATVTFVGGSAAQLAFTTQPASTTAGATLANVVVQIEDAYSNNVSQAGTAITLTLNGGTLYSGTNPQDTDASGKAVFNNLVIRQAGTGLNFTAAGGSLTAATSANFNITKAGTASAVTSSANPALPGASVVFTSTLSVVAPGGGIPTGSVTFKEGASLLGAWALNDAGVATLSTSSLAHGIHVITAQYGGDANFAGSTNSVTQVIDTPPAAGAHFLGATLNTDLTISASALAGLDYDADGDGLTITAVSSISTNGGLVSLSSETITYTPVNNYVGADQFTYTVSDGYLGGTVTSTAKVTVRLGKATSVFNYISSPVDGSITLRGYGIPGHSYDIEVSSNMSSWTTLATVTAAANGIILYTDNNANSSPRYYRLAVH